MHAVTWAGRPDESDTPGMMEFRAICLSVAQIDLLLLTISQVLRFTAPVYSYQLIKLELLTQSIIGARPGQSFLVKPIETVCILTTGAAYVNKKMVQFQIILYYMKNCDRIAQKMTGNGEIWKTITVRNRKSR